MGNAEDIRGLGEEMASSYTDRVKRVATIAKETAATLKGFQKENKEREKMVSGLLAGFREEEEKMAEELRSTLSKNEADRVKEAQAEIRVRVDAVGGLLKGFHIAHEKMSTALRKTLSANETKRLKETQAEIKKRVEDVKGLLAGFQEEREKLASAWQNLVSLMERTRGGKVVVKLEKVPKKEKVAKGPALSAKERKIVAAVRENPDGITLPEIAYIMGVPFITLARNVKSLAGKKVIRKKDSRYFLV